MIRIKPEQHVTKRNVGVLRFDHLFQRNSNNKLANKALKIKIFVKKRKVNWEENRTTRNNSLEQLNNSWSHLFYLFYSLTNVFLCVCVCTNFNVS